MASPQQPPPKSPEGDPLEIHGKSRRLQKLRWMAGGIAHDFNNYLTAILTTAELLRDTLRAGDEETSLGLVDTIAGEIFKAKAVSSQLLAFTQSQPCHPQTFAVQPFLAEVAAFALQGSAVRTVIEVDPGGLTAFCDPDLLEQVLFNLLLNARQIMEDHGFIRLSAKGCKSTSTWALTVLDSGPGIPDDKREKVFEVYYSSRKGGSGLGLYIARDLVNRMEGSLKILPSPQGACFSLILPAGVYAEGPPSQHFPEGRKISGIHSPGDPDQQISLPMEGLLWEIWILEDNQVQRETLSDFFRLRGYAVKGFRRGEDLLALIGSPAPENTIPAFILDVTIEGGKGGLEVVEPIRKAYPESPIVAVSGYTSESSDWSDSLQSLNIHFLAKPYRLQDLSLRIEESFGSIRATD